jgi:hypothetical protein
MLSACPANKAIKTITGKTHNRGNLVLYGPINVAIAEDFYASRAGTVVGQASKSQPEEAALSNCTGSEGKNCEITLTYYNQCAVVAVDENH